MRDLFLTLFIPFFLFYAFRSPIVGLYLWFWTSMYPMQNWLYGFALSFRLNLLFALTTIISYLFVLKNKPMFKVTALFVLIIIFFLHSSLGVALHGYSDVQWDKFFNFFKTIIFFIFCILLLRKKHHFDGILMFLVLALCFHGIIEGLKVVVTLGGHRVGGLHGPLGDNNKVALGLNMAIPLVLYLAEQVKSYWKKMVILGVVLLCVIAVIGTHSRGGLIALCVMGVYFWWKNDNKILILLVAVLLIAVVYNVLPGKWFDRIGALNDVEGSGILDHRVTFWKINFLAALDYPFTGVGFDGTAGKFIWSAYAHSLDSLDWGIDTPVPVKGFVAHSIFFEVLGNQGFVGFVLFMLILLTCFFNMGSLMRHYANDSWQHALVKACRVSLVALCVGGLALNVAYFELLYFIFATVICLTIIKGEPEKKSSSSDIKPKKNTVKRNEYGLIIK